MFKAAKLKIKRANKHISDFQQVVDVFIKTDFCSLGIERNIDTGQNVLQFRMTREPPCDLAMILGDAIHNLRAALDIAFFELVVNIGNEPTDWTTFRVWDDKNKLINTLGQGILKGADDIVSMLANEVCAYVGGNALLGALDSLDIEDKHRLLIPVFSVVQLRHVDADIVMGGTRITMRDCTLGVGRGGVLNVIGSPIAGETKIQSKGQPAFGVFFGDGTSLKGQPIVPTLTQLTQLVGGILETFEKTLLAHAKPAS